MTTEQKVRPFLWFDQEAEEAATFYVSLIPNSRILEVARPRARESGKSALPPG